MVIPVNKILMPAGQYYIGDLCYVLKKEWDECCDLFFAGRNDSGCNEGKFTLKDGRTFVNFNTAYGDGYYHTSADQGLGVDSGSIGCILVSDLSVEQTPEHMAKCGILVTFPEDFYCYSDRGDMTFGRVDVLTTYTDEY